MENMTAKVSCFVRAYHYRNCDSRVFDDEAAELLLGREDYEAIGENMSQGIAFFTPGFAGTKEEALRLIVERQLGPSVLGRSAFCERHLENERMLGCSQYVIFAVGYDTFSFRENASGLTVFELDLPELLTDRRKRVEKSGLRRTGDCREIACDLAAEDWCEKLLAAGFDRTKKSFGSLLGISYYLPREAFEKLLGKISELWQEGAAICLDYPMQNPGEESEKTRKLASGAGEAMQAKYSYKEMEELLSEHGFLIYEHLDGEQMTETYFQEYNEKNPGHEMKAPEGVGYLLAVKK